MHTYVMRSFAINATIMSSIYSRNKKDNNSGRVKELASVFMAQILVLHETGIDSRTSKEK